MLLSIVIVNYRAPDLAVDCLRTMLGDSWNDLYEIIIVDNGSNDDSKEKVLAAFPRVIWLDTGYNAGFTRANNMGMRYAKGDTILLLNADTLPPNESVEQCYRRLYASDYVAAGIQLLNVDGTPQVSGMYVMKGGLNYLLPLPYMGSWIKTFGTLVGVKKPHVPGMAPDLIEVDWINGAFLMVKRSAIDKAGLMDEDFFLYAEEAEWCGRIAGTGKMCIYGRPHGHTPAGRDRERRIRNRQQGIL
ncbi:glycosyltransferase [Puia sp. P3]|uniref:glycosyltransferase n=1 Tax=Puia sp. P3 TaxID=3423952 RepID=UPI003D67314E